MPKSVPLRAIVVTTRRARDAAARQGRQLAGRHAEVEEEVVVAADEPDRLGDVG